MYGTVRIPRKPCSARYSTGGSLFSCTRSLSTIGDSVSIVRCRFPCSSDGSGGLAGVMCPTIPTPRRNGDSRKPVIHQYTSASGPFRDRALTSHAKCKASPFSGTICIDSCGRVVERDAEAARLLLQHAVEHNGRDGDPKGRPKLRRCQ